VRPTIQRIANAIKIALVIVVAVAVFRRLKRSRNQEVTGAARWKPLADPPPPPKRTGPVKFAPVWVEPVDGECPSTHSIKGNADSGIFHVPGGQSYDRTIPERCYATAADAEADGFRQAKR